MNKPNIIVIGHHPPIPLIPFEKAIGNEIILVENSKDALPQPPINKVFELLPSELPQDIKSGQERRRERRAMEREMKKKT